MFSQSPEKKITLKILALGLALFFSPTAFGRDLICQEKAYYPGLSARIRANDRGEVSEVWITNRNITREYSVMLYKPASETYNLYRNGQAIGYQSPDLGWVPAQIFFKPQPKEIYIYELLDHPYFVKHAGMRCK